MDSFTPLAKGLGVVIVLGLVATGVGKLLRADRARLFRDESDQRSVRLADFETWSQCAEARNRLALSDKASKYRWGLLKSADADRRG